MKRQLLYISLITIALCTSCRKVELEPVDGAPVFSSAVLLNGGKQIWQAGVEDYYMFSSFEKDAFDVFVFTGKLAVKSSPCCSDAFEFQFRDSHISANNSTDISSAINTEIDFMFADNSGNDTTIVTQIDTDWQANFIVSSFSQPQQILNYKWDFGDQQTIDSTQIDSIPHIYELNPENQEVTLRASALNNACSSFFTRKIAPLGNPSQNCNLNFFIDSITNNQIQITALPSGSLPFSYLWNDSSTLETYSVNPINIGPVNISVTVTDAQGCTVKAGISTTIIPGAVPAICVAGFDYTLQETYVDTQIIEINYADSLQFSNVTIIYYDDLGNQYRSDRQSQPSTSIIEILDVEDYDNNENNEKTKKINLEFTCRVWNEQGQFIDLTEGKATIAVAYP
ncbi:MAG: hypothetical protein IT258_15880 [Saprospiraceae bacterium]|nr:hypothetical protein [Saprospiraceae bacterium]